MAPGLLRTQALNYQQVYRKNSEVRSVRGEARPNIYLLKFKQYLAGFPKPYPVRISDFPEKKVPDRKLCIILGLEFGDLALFPSNG